MLLANRESFWNEALHCHACNSQQILCVCVGKVCLHHFTNVNLIIGQGVTDDVELERAECLGELLDGHRVACNKAKPHRTLSQVLLLLLLSSLFFFTLKFLLNLKV